jgi:hypothetical protein
VLGLFLYLWHLKFPMTDYELDLLDKLIKNSETDERWFRWLLALFVFLAVFFFAWMTVLLIERDPHVQAYFQGLASAATAVTCALPYRSFSAARADRGYYIWMKTQWQRARSEQDMPALEGFKSEFMELRKRVFGKA